MVIEAFDESGDCLIMQNFWDLKGHIRETSDVVMEQLVLVIAYPFKVVLVAGLLTNGYVIINECLT